MGCGGFFPAKFQTALQETTPGDVTASFVSLGTLSFHTHMLMIICTFNKNVWLSFDGTNNHLLVPATTNISFDIGTNRLKFTETTQIYIKHDGAAPTSGQISILPVQAS